MAVQISGNDITVPRDGSFTRNVTIGGTLTYEDVTNIDSVGLVTARTGIEIGARPGVAASISVDGNMIVSGISTFGGDVQVPDKIIHAGDTNTALRFPAADTITAETGGTERLRIDSGGRIGIKNTSPSSQYFNNLVVGDNSSGDWGITIRTNSSNKGVIAFSDTDAADANRYDGFIAYHHNDQSMRFNTGGANERLRINSGGQIGIRNTNASSFNSGGDDLVIGNATDGADAGITLYSHSSDNCSIFFNDTADTGITGLIQYRHDVDAMRIFTATAERLRITSAGQMVMGATTSKAKFEIKDNGYTSSSALQRISADDDNPYALIIANDTLNTDTVSGLQFYVGNTGTHMIRARGSSTASNNNLQLVAQNEVIFNSGSSESERLRIHSNGQIRVGDDFGNPLTNFDVVRTSASSYTDVMLIKGNVGNGFIRFQDSDNSCNWSMGVDDGSSTSTNSFIFYDRVNNAYRLQISNGGKVRTPATYNLTTTGGGPLYVESDGDLLRYTSSIKYKTDVETIENDIADKILNCRPVKYKSKCGNDVKTEGSDKSDWTWYGFIAEEVAEIEPRLVNWATKDFDNSVGESVERDPSNYEAEGVRYDNFVPLLVNLVKRQKAEIESLKARLDAAGL